MTEWKEDSNPVSALDNVLYIPTVYNYQLDNTNYKALMNYAQCGYTSAFVFLSAWLPEFKDDSNIEEIIKEIDYDFITGKSKSRKGAFQKEYSKYFTKKLPNKKIVTRPHSGTKEEMIDALKGESPLFTSTMLTDSGHYVCIVGYNITQNSFIVNDPYGYFDFTKNKYTNTKYGAGKKVLYKYEDFKRPLEKSSKVATGRHGFRYIYAT